MIMRMLFQKSLDSHEPLRLEKLVFILCISFLAVFLGSCAKAETVNSLAERMAEEDGQASDDERIRELKGKIRSIDQHAEKLISQVRDKGTFYRLLGLKYMDYSMWGEALEAFDEAAAIYPDHAALQYNRALCAAQYALSMIRTEDKIKYFGMAESGYRRAIAIDDRYTSALYGLAVLLVFELNRPLEAADYLDRYLAIERSAIPARFLRARV